MQDFSISDLHISHYNILKYENRPFKNINEMNNTIISNWNSVVKHDRVFLLGDVMFSRDCSEIIEFLNKLNGQIIIIPGNHDQELKKIKYKFNNIKEKIYISDEIYEPKVKINNLYEKVVLCHYPMFSWNASFHGRKHFYGHVHSKALDYKLENAYNVSADVLNFTPRTFDQIISGTK